MNLRSPITSLYATGVILLGISVFGYFSHGSRGVHILEPDREVSVQTPGQAVEISFRISNPRNDPAWVVGLEEC